jgi:cell wall-associated NlpC family hydrolase
MSDDFSKFIENAVNWALNHVGSIDYRTLCLGFVEDAYELSNDIWLDGYPSAKEESDAFSVEYNDEIPPKGTFVFFDCFGTINETYKNWGHVGLSLGDGRVVHAWDKVRVDTIKCIEKLDAAKGWTKPKYIGWAPVTKVFEGYKKKN